MTNQRHPITPPPELVQQWFDIWQGSDDDDVAFADFVVVRASQYGADQELEACIQWLVKTGYWGEDGKAIHYLRAARRPKPPSLKDEALEWLTTVEPILKMQGIDPNNTIRRALESIND